MQWEYAQRLVKEHVHQNHSMLIQDVVLPNNHQMLEDCVDWQSANDREIYEWWCVDEFLAKKLKSKDEYTIKYGFGHWWGRTISGQQIISDRTIQEIAEELYA